MPDTHIATHWNPLPGWSPGRTLLACYLTVDDQPGVHELADAYQRALADVAALDLVDRRWLHATVQGVWFTDALPPTAAASLAVALGDALAEVPAAEVDLAPPVIGAEGVFLPLRPVEGLVRVRNTVRDAVRRSLGLAEPYALPGQSGDFDPHVSLAYANAPFPAADLRERLDSVAHAPTRFTVRAVTLLRVERTWRWTEAVHLPLGTAWEPGGADVRTEEVAGIR